MMTPEQKQAQAFKDMLFALTRVWDAMVAGNLVWADATKPQEILNLMSVIQGAVIRAQGGHRGKASEE